MSATRRSSSSHPRGIWRWAEGSNPCLGIRRYRRKGRTRFLSDDEMRRLSARLSAHADSSPRQVAVVRLLLLTGCPQLPRLLTCHRASDHLRRKRAEATWLGTLR